MANPEHLKTLKKGVDHWNKWRNENLFISPDLNGANLKGWNLNGANLSMANLIWANLQAADLQGTDLRGASLNMANLFDADLSNAKLFETQFSEVDLWQVKGLESCEHSGPSPIDQRTLVRSGKLPEVFLKGCGFPDELINYLPGLLGSLEPIQFYSSFISYSTKDDEFAHRLYADLQGKGIRCWFAPEDMKIGDKIRPRIDEVIRVHDKLLLVLSENSVNSEWVEKEVETAFGNERERKETVLFPIRLDDSVMEIKNGWPADIRRTRHIGDFTNWKDRDSYQAAIKRLLRDLGKEE